MQVPFTLLWKGSMGYVDILKNELNNKALRHVMGSTVSQKRPTHAESFITSTNLDKMR